MTRKFSLRWLDFHTNLYESLQAVLKAEELVDVTLSAGGKDFHAHKLILSICSPFFKDLFLKNPCEHPIVILKEVEHVELNKLLQFIYHGEVHVTQQELNPFLETAEFLQIKGLSSVRERNETAADEPDDIQETNEPNPTIDCQAEGSSKINDATEPTEPPIASVSESIQEDPVQEASSSLNRSFESNPNNESSCNEKINSGNSDTTHLPSNDVPNDSSQETEAIGPTSGTICSNRLETATDPRSCSNTDSRTNIKCVYCYRLFANSYNLKVHIQDKHETEVGSIKCHKCDRYMKNPSCLRVHIYKHHKPVYRHHSYNHKP